MSHISKYLGFLGRMALTPMTRRRMMISSEMFVPMLIWIVVAMAVLASSKIPLCDDESNLTARKLQMSLNEKNCDLPFSRRNVLNEERILDWHSHVVELIDADSIVLADSDNSPRARDGFTPNGLARLSMGNHPLGCHKCQESSMVGWSSTWRLCVEEVWSMALPLSRG